jgi:hypothetical protein
MNWRAPVDYTKGTVHGYVEVLSRPTTAPAKFAVCLEGGGSYACTIAPVYTTEKVLRWHHEVSQMYQFAKVDWTRGPFTVAFIQRSGSGAQEKIDPAQVGEAEARMFLPTTLRVVITFVAAGATYVPPAASTDAGPPDSAPARDAATLARDAGMEAAAASAPSGTNPSDATRAEASSPTVAPAPSPSPVRDDEPAPPARPMARAVPSGCHVAPAPGGGAGAALVLAGLAITVIRRRARRCVAPDV